MRFLLMTSLGLLGTLLYGEDIAIPLEGGNILIRDARFELGSHTAFLPELSFTIRNSTSSGWDLKLRLDITGRCKGGKGDARQWSRTVMFSLKQTQVEPYLDTGHPLVGEREGCVLEKMDAALLSAENRNLRIDGITGERVDYRKQREIAAEAQAKIDAVEAEAQAKIDAAAAARHKRLAAEQKRKQAEADARYVTIKAETDAKAAEEQRKIRAACTVIYQKTVDMKVKDLTVREEQQVRACQALSLYPPQ